MLAVAFGAGSLGASVAATAPTIAFLLVAVALAGLAVRAGFASWAADNLAAVAGQRSLFLYALVCLSTAVATALVSLDGAVVLLVPVVLELARRGASLRRLLLGVVAVANAFSLGLPEGNPTNLRRAGAPWWTLRRLRGSSTAGGSRGGSRLRRRGRLARARRSHGPGLHPLPLASAPCSERSCGLASSSLRCWWC